MFAIIDYKGSQIKVTEKGEYRFPLFDCKKGDKITFDQVLLISGDKVLIGQPYLKSASVKGEVLEIGQTSKTSVIKFHSKKRYKKIGSHRQDFVTIKIDKILEK